MFATGIILLLCFLHIICSKKRNGKTCSLRKRKESGYFYRGKPFTSFNYPDSIEKPVLYPIHAANGTVVTRGFPLDTRPGDPTDHPHHIGLWSQL
jgi:hypothetical protein